MTAKPFRTLPLAALALVLFQAPAGAQVPTDLELLEEELPSPIPPRPGTVWMEDMTWVEIRDAIQDGATTAILPTGGAERAGPYAVTGKHNYLIEYDAQAIAERLGNALVAPVLRFAPTDYGEGLHLRFPGTFNLPDDLFKEVVRELAIDLERSGFTEIVLIAENLPNNELQEEVAEALNAEWEEAGKRARVHHLQEYYDDKWDSDDDVVERGIVQENQGIHDSFRVTATLMAIDPSLVRLDERMAAGDDALSINAVPILPSEDIISHGKRIRESRIRVAVDRIRELQADSRH